MPTLPKTKIIATIGPSTWEDEVLIEMINHGFVIARINASFADFKELERVSTQLRKLSPRVAVMLDTMGHKIRVTGFKDEKILNEGDKVTLVSEGIKGTRGAIKVTYPTLHEDLVRGTKILIDDGNMTLLVNDISKEKVICEVVSGGVLKPGKTVNVPGAHLNFPSLSEKDEGDIKYAVKHNFDLISASFIRNVEDVKLIREAMGETDTKLIAKIEDYEGVQDFDEILEVVDGIMVARGDLGVELEPEKVPLLQKKFIFKCRMKGKPVIVATQMLESMRDNNRPTRAEASDVANAVMDGADALMLSAETSTGSHPVEAVKMMAKIALEVEQYMTPQVVNGRTDATEATDVLCRQVYQMAEELNLAGVIIISQTGKSVASLSRHRLKIPIWSISTNPKVIRQQQLLRGVHGYYVQSFQNDRDELINQAIDVVYGKGQLDLNNRVAVISGSSLNGKRNNSILEIVRVEDVVI